MKNFNFTIIFLLLLGMISTITTVYAQGRERIFKPIASNERVLGNIDATFEHQPEHFTNRAAIDNMAYRTLVQAANRQYQGIIDVRDVTWQQGRRISGVAIGPMAQFAVFEFIATGKVVMVSADIRAVDSALTSAAKKLIDELTSEVQRQASVAILSVYSDDPLISSFVIDKLEQQLHDARYFTIIEQRFITEIRDQKRMQESDEIDQRTAAELGRERGWNVVIIGEVTGTGAARRLTLRAVDATRATVLSRVWEQF